MSTDKQHFFVAAMTTDGKSVGGVTTFDNRVIQDMLRDRPDGYYRLLSKAELHDAYNFCAVYLWVSHDD